MTEHSQIYPNFDPADTGERVKAILEMAGDNLISIIIQEDSLIVKTSEPIDMKQGNTIMEIVLELDMLQELQPTGPAVEPVLDHVLMVLEVLAKRAEPRFFLVAPNSDVLKDGDLSRFLHAGGAYKSLFGMLVVEEKTLDTRSFVLCGSSGPSWEIAAITMAFKRALP